MHEKDHPEKVELCKDHTFGEGMAIENVDNFRQMTQQTLILATWDIMEFKLIKVLKFKNIFGAHNIGNRSCWIGYMERFCDRCAY